eukprot:CAMPEP_0177274178 /NCGR_PEP_ID=MMETSP0367-20130122/67030_1 /TAXON_ID=447022 ORGANISM="Scrippsiella hangoei-like, Strain SHHI-4" /NCGR_SAMPLE_ID=MMETSP0367 /ASSEMBLY_ACC=CAM_ASM_000362 /LENGTH=107 /DNA_ID=CAMNT_0018730499 /DNA_START=605 /DNA_END=925 /DNA_ORIENTATION=-
MSFQGVYEDTQLRLRHQEDGVLDESPPRSKRAVCPHAAAPDKDVIVATCPVEEAQRMHKTLEQGLGLQLAKRSHVQVACRVVGHEEKVGLFGIVRPARARKEPIMKH